MIYNGKIKKINIYMLKSQNYQTFTKIQLINNFKINNNNFGYDILFKKLIYLACRHKTRLCEEQKYTLKKRKKSYTNIC